MTKLLRLFALTLLLSFGATSYAQADASESSAKPIWELQTIDGEPELEVLAFNVFDDLAVEDYPTKAKWPFVHILGGDEFARVHGVKGLPTLFVLNGDGKMILDLREIDTNGPATDTSHRSKAAHHAPLWEEGLRKALQSMDWSK